MKRKFPKNYIKQLFSWIWRGKFHILTVSAVIITMLYLLKILDFYPNIVASALSIIGLLIILILQLLDAREFADERPNTIRNWIKSFPTGKPITISLKAGLLSSLGMKAHAKVSIAEDATLEKKVDFLLRQFSYLEDVITHTDDRIDDLSASQNEATKDIKSDLERLNTSLKMIIAGHIVGDYDKNLFGIVITICGTLIQFFCT